MPYCAVNRNCESLTGSDQTLGLSQRTNALLTTRVGRSVLVGMNVGIAVGIEATGGVVVVISDTSALFDLISVSTGVFTGNG